MEQFLDLKPIDGTSNLNLESKIFDFPFMEEERHNPIKERFQGGGVFSLEKVEEQIFIEDCEKGSEEQSFNTIRKNPDAGKRTNVKVFPIRNHLCKVKVVGGGKRTLDRGKGRWSRKTKSKPTMHLSYKGNLVLKKEKVFPLLESNEEDTSFSSKEALDQRSLRLQKGECSKWENMEKWKEDIPRESFNCGLPTCWPIGRS
ncbi:hypothetical protein Ddye_024244 [Dipteronia dyeriana]|uniref:Uncharacterized protein n=1 Tax=Dipteronia dyeriana TaxID=168575 RepID=A0AAD9WTE4_9ROSI|nr:hypothetical protein Ddye_024244 [Dipteronia dyeriana]